jgi:uncharacterized membrane protein YphA (DoxX/SURF4 family)
LRRTSVVPPDDCDHRRTLLRRVLCIGFAAGILLSYPLWTSSRSFPLAPVAGWIGALPFPLDHALAVTLIASLLAATLVESSIPLIGALAATFVLAAQDQSRWQPWVYQYALMLGVLVCGQSAARGSNERSRGDAMVVCRAIVSGLYFWSGVQKLNASFLEGGLLAIVPAGALPVAMQTLLVRTGVLVPLLEIVIGLGLLSPYTRRAAAAAAVAMHVLILLLIGPLGDAWNSVVWPWNAAMIASVWLLSRGDEGAARTLGLITADRSRGAVVAHGLCVVAFWVLPAFSFADAWDAYLSASLYSKNIKQAAVKIAPEAAARMPQDIRARIDTEGLLWLMDWSLDELNVPAYPEERVFRRVAAVLCVYSRTPDDVVLIVAAKPPVFGGERDAATLRCADLED